MLNSRVQELVWVVLSCMVAAGFLYFSFKLLGVNFGLFNGIGTFNINFVIAVFFVTFVAGIIVAVIYGLGAKIIAHFPPLIVMIPQYMSLEWETTPPGYTILPFGYWILMLILAAEFCALGGFAGESLVKKIYGRRPRHKVHVRFKSSIKDRMNSKQDNN